MNKIEATIRNESLENVLAVFALRIGYPSIDRMYARYGRGRVSNLDLLIAYKKLIDTGVLVHADRMTAAKGPNWKAPAFLIEGKYDNFIEE